VSSEKQNGFTTDIAETGSKQTTGYDGYYLAMSLCLIKTRVFMYLDFLQLCKTPKNKSSVVSKESYRPTDTNRLVAL